VIRSIPIDQPAWPDVDDCFRRTGTPLHPNAGQSQAVDPASGDWWSQSKPVRPKQAETPFFDWHYQKS
jgi:hypothetical protein